MLRVYFCIRTASWEMYKRINTLPAAREQLVARDKASFCPRTHLKREKSFNFSLETPR